MRVRLRAIWILTCGIGVGAAGSAFVIYMTRYSQFDALYGEVDQSLYLRITAMSVFEKVAIAAGLLLAAIGAIGAALSMRITGHPRR